MSSDIDDCVDGNAAAGELSDIFTMDVTAAEGQCAHCGAIKRFAEAHVYMRAPGIVARCSVCQHVLLRFVKARARVFLDLHGMRCLTFHTSQPWRRTEGSDFQKKSVIAPPPFPPRTSR